MPVQHSIVMIYAHSPLGQLLINYSHRTLGCNRGTQAYVGYINFLGFHAKNLHTSVQEHKDNCSLCPRIQYLFSGHSPLQDIFWAQRSSDDILGTALSTDPLNSLICDEAGPFTLDLLDGKYKIFCLLAVELVTRRVFLLPLPQQDIISLVKCLEMLQSRRGALCNIVLDRHASRLCMATHPKAALIDPALDTHIRCPTLYNLLAQQESHRLDDIGIKVTVATGKYHRLVGFAEHAVFNLKKVLTTICRAQQPDSLFSFYHWMALIEHYLNARPTLHDKNLIISPDSFEIAALRRAKPSPVHPSTLILSDFIFPSTRSIALSLRAAATESKQVLTNLVATLATRLLNYKPLSHSVTIGDIVYIPDLLSPKNPTSLRSAIGKIVASDGSNNFTIQMIGKSLISRHVSSVVPADHTRSQDTVDILHLPLWDMEAQPIPQDSNFNLNLDSFSNPSQGLDPHHEHILSSPHPPPVSYNEHILPSPHPPPLSPSPVPSDPNDKEQLLPFVLAGPSVPSASNVPSNPSSSHAAQEVPTVPRHSTRHSTRSWRPSKASLMKYQYD